MVSGIIEGDWILFCLGNMISDLGIIFLALAIMLNKNTIFRNNKKIKEKKIIKITIIIISIGVIFQAIALL